MVKGAPPVGEKGEEEAGALRPELYLLDSAVELDRNEPGQHL